MIEPGRYCRHCGYDRVSHGRPTNPIPRACLGHAFEPHDAASMGFALPDDAAPGVADVARLHGIDPAAWVPGATTNAHTAPMTPALDLDAVEREWDTLGGVTRRKRVNALLAELRTLRAVAEAAEGVTASGAMVTDAEMNTLRARLREWRR